MTLNGAIMQLVEMRENSMMPVIFKPYFEKVIETISECVEPSDIPQWIPCSEHQPKRCAFYIVTDSNEVDKAYYNSDGRWFSWDGNKLKDVVAWMPLPEPYKGEE